MARNDEGGGNYSRVSSRSFCDRWREPWPIKAAAELRKTAAGEQARPLRPLRLQGEGPLPPAPRLSHTTGKDFIRDYPLSGRRGVWGGGRRGRSVHRNPEALVEGREGRLCKRSAADGCRPFISLRHRRESCVVFPTEQSLNDAERQSCFFPHLAFFPSAVATHVELHIETATQWLRRGETPASSVARITLGHSRPLETPSRRLEGARTPAHAVAPKCSPVPVACKRHVRGNGTNHGGFFF